MEFDDRNDGESRAKQSHAMNVSQMLYAGHVQRMDNDAIEAIIRWEGDETEADWREGNVAITG